jgi:hypothetical protein
MGQGRAPARLWPKRHGATLSGYVDDMGGDGSVRDRELRAQPREQLLLTHLVRAAGSLLGKVQIVGSAHRARLPSMRWCC